MHHREALWPPSFASKPGEEVYASHLRPVRTGAPLAGSERFSEHEREKESGRKRRNESLFYSLAKPRPESRHPGDTQEPLGAECGWVKVSLPM